jgi:hypothetical protein
MSWFGKKEEPKATGGGIQRRARLAESMRMVDACYEGGTEAFKRDLEREEYKADVALRMIDRVVAKRGPGYAGEALKAIWHLLAPDVQLDVAIDTVEGYMRLEARCKAHGIATD